MLCPSLGTSIRITRGNLVQVFARVIMWTGFDAHYAMSELHTISRASQRCQDVQLGVGPGRWVECGRRGWAGKKKCLWFFTDKY